MHATLPLLKSTNFPPLTRRTLDTLQVNLGYRCNQACHHCHVNASPDRKEMMSRETVVAETVSEGAVTSESGDAEAVPGDAAFTRTASPIPSRRATGFRSSTP